MLGANTNPSSGNRRVGRAVLRSSIASARALLDLVEQHLPSSLGADAPTDALAKQLAEELVRLARELVACARRIAPEIELNADAESAA